MKPHAIRVVLMGTGPFAVPSFDAIVEAGHDVAMVVTRPVPPVKSRRGPPPSPVRDWATSRGLTIVDPETINDPSAVDLVRQMQPDLLVVCDYGQILKPDALATSCWGGLNLHGSLLPAYRGAAPVQRALLSGDRRTGVSVIHMTPKLDGGPIITTRSTDIDDQETSGELEHRLSRIGVDAMIEAMEIVVTANGQPVGVPQDPSKVSRAPRLSKAEGCIDWNQSIRMVGVHVRGMQPWPGAFTHVLLENDKPNLRLVVRRLRLLEDLPVPEDMIGRTLDDSALIIGCRDGAVELERVAPAGKKEMSGADFCRGQRLPIGTRLK
ncbi:MAG: methionyl-tRNA formyltransferase [Planctomycetota bacterium]